MEGRRTETDKSDYSDKSDGNGAWFMTVPEGMGLLTLKKEEGKDMLIGKFLPIQSIMEN